MNNDYFNDVYKQLARKYQLDPELVRDICRSEFKYTKLIMDSDCTKDILFNRLFKFKLKKKYAINKTISTIHKPKD